MKRYSALEYIDTVSLILYNIIKLKQERERFSRELADAKDVLTQEHESKMQQLQADYDTAQNEIQQLKEEQV